MEDVFQSVTRPQRVSGDIAKPVYAPVVLENEVNPRLLNPRQRLAWDSYINPKSKTFGNALQSALHAGYHWEYANTITTRPWWVGKVRRLRLLNKAEKVLSEMLELPNEPGFVRVRQDTAKFVAERLGKDEGYSSRSELTGAGGAPITVPDEKQKQVNEALLKFLDGK